MHVISHIIYKIRASSHNIVKWNYNIVPINLKEITIIHPCLFYLSQSLSTLLKKLEKRKRTFLRESESEDKHIAYCREMCGWNGSES